MHFANGMHSRGRNEPYVRRHAHIQGISGPGTVSLNLEDLLVPGEKVLAEDGRAHFTDRRIIVLERNSFAVLPYDQISSMEFERKVPLAPIIAGVVVMMVGLFLWLSPQQLRALNLDPTFTLTVIGVLAILLVGLGFALTRRGLTIWMTSGRSRYLRIKNEAAVGEFIRSTGRPFPP